MFLGRRICVHLLVVEMEDVPSLVPRVGGRRGPYLHAACRRASDRRVRLRPEAEADFAVRTVAALVGRGCIA